MVVVRPVHCILPVVALLLAQAAAGPVFSTVGGGGTSDDLFDVSRGAQVIFSSPQHNSCCGDSDPRMALGFGALPPWVEPGTSIFADGPGSGHVDTIEWQTCEPVNLNRIEIRLSQDGASAYRGTSAYRLLASADGLDFWLISGGQVPLRNGVMANAPLLITDQDLTGVTTGLRAFRLELTRLSDGGPRLIEIDGFGTPETTTIEFLDRLAFNAANNLLTGRAGAAADDEGPGLAIEFAVSSRQNGIDRVEDAFGNANGSLAADAFAFADGGVQDNGTEAMGDGGETVDYVAWATDRPLCVKGYRLIQGGNDAGVWRNLELVRFLVDGEERDFFDNAGRAGEVLRRFAGDVVEGSRFRVELTRATSAGPRLIEMDALLASPPPSPVLTNGVVLNEIVGWNDESATDDDGDSPSWFEVFNASEQPANLKAWGASDDPRAPYRWIFPAISLAPHGYLRVFASGKDRASNPAWLHTNFRIDPDGETLLLTRPDGTRGDTVAATRSRRDVSLGRMPNGTGPWKFLADATPAQSNSPQKGYDSVVFDRPWFSHPAGFYPDPLQLALAPTEADTVVRYTLDGGEPTEDSPLFTAPVEVGSREGDANVLSMISGIATANQHTDGWRAPLGKVRKATVVRARAFRPGALPGPVGTQTYWIGSAALRTDGLPTLSIVTETNGLFDYYRGIYMLGAVFDQYVASHPGEALTGHTPANYTQRGPAWERAADVECFAPDGLLAWSEPVILDIKGQSSRSFRQKSFGLKARGETGKENTIEHALFPGLARLGDGAPLVEFRHLRLRNAGNDWDVAMMRDDWCHRLVAGLGLDVMSSRPVSLFLDGEYWGVLTLREEQDPQYLREHYGLDPSEAVILHGTGVLDEGNAGDNTVFRALRDYVSTHDLAVSANYSYVQARFDMDDFILYQLCEIYFANIDWPQNNTRVWRRRLSATDLTQPHGLDGRWRWLLFDVDLGAGHPWSAGYTEDTLAVALSPTDRSGFDNPWATAFLRALIRNPDFKRDFLNTAADLLNSSFLPARAVALVNAMEAELRPAMGEHLRRWRSCGGIVSTWQERVQVLRSFAQNRASRMRQHCVSALAPTGTVQITVNVTDPAIDRIRVNRLTVDSNLPGAGATPYPWRGTYFCDAAITLEAIPGPGRRFVGWTGLATTNRVAIVKLTNMLSITANFEAASQDWTALVLTELHYHPASSDGVTDDAFEFLELQNTGIAALDLTGLAFTRGIAFAFTNGATLAPGAFLVLAQDPFQLPARFPGIEAHGRYTGRLDNAGETLTLRYPGASTVFELTYDDERPWPALADGGGMSLQRANALPDSADARNWCAAPPTPGAPLPPAHRDSDGDGLPDHWELAHALDPANAADAVEDADRDGLDNRQEFQTGTDPRDASSALRFERVSLGTEAASVVLAFVARSNVACRVEANSMPGGSVWTGIAFVPQLPADRLISITNRVEAAVRFFRLVVSPQ